ncbi:MAG: serine/threonine protein kinase [candidate division Zixibacteria bacterium]|nr:serine/threonine protein kinase [candidate division Zixibacteria bacterium]
MDQQSPLQILQYALTEKLGERSVGEVYQAWDTALERVVALRLIPAELNRDRLFRAQCLSTLRGLANISHPNLCGMYGATEAGGKLVVVLDYVPGRNLKSLIASGPLDNAAFLKIAVAMIRGLVYAHEHGIVHGNIRPSNVVATKDGIIKLMDFGLSLHAVSSDEISASADLDAIRYRSPEHIVDQDLTPMSDLFSIGAIFWELLTGQMLFSGNSARAIEDAILRTQPDFNQLRSEFNLPGDTVLLLEKLLAKIPEDRFLSTRQLLVTLEEMQSFDEGYATREFFQVRPSTPRQYLVLSVLAALMIVLWLVVTTGHK